MLATRDGWVTRRCCQDVDSAAKWLLAALAVGVAGYVSLSMASYFIWVATSAFLGIRAAPDYGLGLVCSIAAVAPFVAAVAGYCVGRSARSRRRSIVCGALACTAVGFASTLFAVMLTLPF